jgi:hemerythrin-like domain-containing protein
VDFLRTYADRCHHGKEEDILFRDLGNKPLSDDLRQVMDGLISDHAFARKTVAKLVAAEERRRAGDDGAKKDVAECLDGLVEVYSAHIEKEDKHFFLPAMKYFTAQEQDAMLQEFWGLDRKMIHEKYQGIVKRCEDSRDRAL